MLVGFIFLGLCAVETFKLESSPHLEWDEGWTALVARNWVEKGHYGLWLMGKPAPPALNASFPTSSLVALSFKWLGVGIWQGRLVGVVSIIGSFILLFLLVRRLFNQKTAWLTLAILCLSPLPYKFHPLGIGRQILAEPQMLFFILAGYLCFLSAQAKPSFYMPLTVLFWGTALITKAQVLPFWIIALFIPMVMNLYKRQWKSAWLLGIALFGSLTFSYLLLWFQKLLLQGQTLPRVPVENLYWIVAFVFQWHIRLEALSDCLWYGWPTLLGLGYGGWKWYKKFNHSNTDPEKHMVQLSLLLFVIGWISWFVLLSIGYLRYLLPPVFIGSIFEAGLLGDLMGRVRLGLSADRIRAVIRSVPLKRKVIFILVMVVGAAGTAFNISIPDRLHRFLFDSGDIPLFQAANFLNNHTSSKALIESFDSQILFLLDRPIHYPPPHINGEVTKRVFLRLPLTVDYDPLLTTDLDYLVVGPYGRLWKLYDPILRENQFHLLHTFGLYDIYERRR